MESEAARAPRRRTLPVRTAPLVAFIAFVVALAITGYVAMQSPGGIQAFTGTLFMPFELRSANFFAIADVTKPGPSVIYRVGPFGYERAIPRVLHPLSAPDGRYAVRAVLTATSTREGEATDPSNWKVELLLKGKPPVALGAGVAPFFIDNVHVGRFTPLGIFIADLSNGKIVQAYSGNLARMQPVILVSPDRTLIAWHDYLRNAEVIARVTPMKVTELGTVTDELVSPALGAHALYDIRSTDTGTEVWSYPLTGGAGHRVLTIPASLHIVHLSF